MACPIAAMLILSCGQRQARDAARALGRRVATIEKPEWTVREPAVERLLAGGQRLNVVAFRAGGGLIALLQHAPDAWWGFMFQAPGAPSGGAIGAPPHGMSAPGFTTELRSRIKSPSDIVGVSADGVAWYLDAATGRITSLSVSGYRAPIPGLRLPGTARRACALAGGAIAFLDDTAPGRVFVQDLNRIGGDRSLTLPTQLLTDAGAEWSELRFGGSLGGPCILWAPVLPTVVVVTDSATRPLGPFIETMRPDPWYTRFRRWVERKPSPVAAISATSFPGGVAVLFGGRTPYAHRLVDFYSKTGRYLESMLLPKPALSIAEGESRLFVLSQIGGAVRLASYILPDAIPVGTIPPATPLMQNPSKEFAGARRRQPASR